MKVYWKRQKTKDQFEDIKYLQKTYDQKIARSIVRRLIELREAEDYTKLPKASHPHLIKDGKKLKYFAVDLPGLGRKRGKYRLTFSPFGDYDPKHLKTIKSVLIIGIIDYH